MRPSRNDNETTSPPPQAGHQQPTHPWHNDNETTTPCPVCGTPFTPIRRQRYCTPACRQAAWRRRHTPPPEPAIAAPPRTPRRAITVYHCTGCDTRTLGQQWCHDCNQPRTRLDTGALCPHCDEPITFRDITDQHPTTTSP